VTKIKSNFDRQYVEAINSVSDALAVAWLSAPNVNGLEFTSNVVCQAVAGLGFKTGGSLEHSKQHLLIFSKVAKEMAREISKGKAHPFEVEGAKKQ
jgi:hypothetical protein